MSRILSSFLAVSLLAGAPPSHAQEIPSSSSAPLALVGGTVLASPEAEPVPDGVVLVEDGKIVAVGPRGSVEIPGDASILRVDGGTVTAGFWNTHIHRGILGGADQLSDAALEEALQMALTRWGFVRAVELHTSDLRGTRETQRRVADGSVPGPSILTVGAAFDPEGGDHLGLGLPQIRSPKEAREKVRRRIEQGVDAIKVMTGSLGPDSIVVMAPEVARAAVDVAHSAGLKVLAHPSNEAGTRVAIEAGVDALAHVFATYVPADWDRSLIETMLEREIALIPTLAVFEASDVARTQLHRFQKGGGTVLFGTDLGYLTDPDPTSEYWLMHQAGMSARQILASLTTAPARFFGLAEKTGRVEPGLAADLVVLNGSPLDDPEGFARVRYTLHEGRIVYDKAPWDPDAWERRIGRPYVSLFHGIPTVTAKRSGIEVVELTPAEARSYAGSYPSQADEGLRVWVENGRLWITPIPGLDVTHLVPLGSDEFVQGLYRDGRLAEIYQPRFRIRFIVEDGRAAAMMMSRGNWSSGRIERVN